ncbi:MAG: hypothetical protein JW797_06875 [Bradymonadales bacterium]|nr:hypothetical protein [Bradymonadales bacterium]
MTTKSKIILLVALTFLLGLGLGGAGGFLLNDYLERENPDAVQQIRQEFETQNQLEELFARQRAERANSPATE